jgi:hypothetical protein
MSLLVNIVSQILVLILFGICTKLDDKSVLRLGEGNDSDKRVIIPGGANAMMGSYGSKSLFLQYFHFSDRHHTLFITRSIVIIVIIVINHCNHCNHDRRYTIVATLSSLRDRHYAIVIARSRRIILSSTSKLILSFYWTVTLLWSSNMMN